MATSEAKHGRGEIEKGRVTHPMEVCDRNAVAGIATRRKGNRSSTEEGVQRFRATSDGARRA